MPKNKKPSKKEVESDSLSGKLRQFFAPKMNSSTGGGDRRDAKLLKAERKALGLD